VWQISNIWEHNKVSKLHSWINQEQIDVRNARQHLFQNLLCAILLPENSLIHIEHPGRWEWNGTKVQHTRIDGEMDDFYVKCGSKSLLFPVVLSIIRAKTNRPFYVNRSIWRLKYTELQFCRLFSWDLKLDRSHSWRSIDWGYHVIRTVHILTINR